MFRSLFLGAAIAALGAAAPALAAPATTWTGFYAGVNAGYGGNEFRYPVDATLSDSIGPLATVNGSVTQTSSGPLGGGQVGYNVQLANGWILGGEADIDGAGIRGENVVTGSASGFGGTGALTASASSTIDWLGTVRARVGVPVFDGRLAPYVAGGLAYGGVTSSASFAAAGGAIGAAASVHKTSTDVGWTVGTGADYALTDRLALRAEYLYVDLGRATLLSGSTAIGSDVLTGSLRRETTAHIMRVGLNYHFWP